MGERSPINDTDARACFIGMSMDTSRSDLTQAVLEGVAFAIRDSFEVARSLGVAPTQSMLCGGGAKSLGIKLTHSMLCGGGAKSPLWRRILAGVLNIRLDLPQTEDGPGYGGAMLAMVCCGAYGSVAACAAQLVHVRESVEPDPALAARYEERYQKFRIIYPAMKNLFQEVK